MHQNSSWIINVKQHLRKNSAYLLNLAINHQIVFRMIGWLNRRFDFLSSVFVVYPASREYALSYVYERHLHLSKWQPWLVGLFKQNGKWGILLGISSVEEDFYQSENKIKLQELADKVEFIRKCVGAQQKTFSGILPGILHANAIVTETTEANVTVKVVLEAEKQVRRLERLDDDIPLVLLGGEGFIGRRLKVKFQERELYSVDIANQMSHKDSWPDHLKGKPAILLNVSRKSALLDYLPKLWPEIILLNEVYPEPSKACMQQLAKQRISTYHVVGVSGSAYPPFPRAYQGGIPACAARLTPEMQVMVRKLT